MDTYIGQAAELAGMGLDAWLRNDYAIILALPATLLARSYAGLRNSATSLLVAFLVLRLLLVGNPWAWQFYAQHLKHGDVGWRQYSVIHETRYGYLGMQMPSRYLAVGSSQTNAIYAKYAQQHKELAIFEMAGMMPIDLMLYREQIARYRPEVILLYLSEFDLAREQPPESISMAPGQGAYLVSLWSRFRAFTVGDDYNRALTELLVGEVFPEFKYSFVFRSILDKEIRKLSGRFGKKDARPSTRVPRSERIRLLRESISPEYTAFNMTFLREFISFAGSINSRVVIVEGQYHPEVSTDAISKVNREVVEQLNMLAREFEHVRFIARTETGDFTDADYMDLTHVTQDVGYDFTGRLIASLEAGNQKNRLPSKGDN